MDVPDHVEQLRRDGKRLATVASFTDPGAGADLPDWSLRDLVHHVGACIDGRPGSSGVPDASRRMATSSDSSEGGPRTPSWWRGSRTATERSWRRSRRLQPTWRRGRSSRLYAAHLLGAPPGHETAIHRVDAERACGDVTGFPSGFAVDGIDELLLRFANRPGRTMPAVETTRSMVVRAKDEPRAGA